MSSASEAKPIMFSSSKHVYGASSTFNIKSASLKDSTAQETFEMSNVWETPDSAIPPEMSQLPTKPKKSKQHKTGSKSCFQFSSRQKELDITWQLGHFDPDYLYPASAYRRKVPLIVEDLRNVIKYVYPTAEICLTGSYVAGLDLPESDLDVSLHFPSEVLPWKHLNLIQHAYEKLQPRFRWISCPFERLQMCPGRIPLLRMIHKRFNVSLDISISNCAAERNTQLLLWYSQIDPRFVILCRAVKAWAKEAGVQNTKRRRLNSLSVCYMLVHYLQAGVSPPVLPNLQAEFPQKMTGEIRINTQHYHDFNPLPDLMAKLNLDNNSNHPIKSCFVPGANKDSLGKLYLGFMKYYATFDFNEKWISVKHGRALPKEWSEDGTPLNGLPEFNSFIVVEDPFLRVPRNCAGTVSTEKTMKQIQSAFKRACYRITKKDTIQHYDIFMSCPPGDHKTF